MPQAEQRVIVLTSEQCHTVNISCRHDTYSIKVEKSSELTGTFQICFWHFISFSEEVFIKIFEMSQTEVALNMKVFLHNVPLIFLDKQVSDLITSSLKVEASLWIVLHWFNINFFTIDLFVLV